MSTEWAKWRRKIWSVTRGPTKFETEILECLARFGPLNIHQTTRKLHRAYSSTRKAIFSLVNKKFLKETGFKTVEHTKLETQTYDLTLKSIFFVLWKEMGYADTEKWDYKFIDNVIRKYNSLLPLIFGKWRHFARMKVEKIAFFRLKVLVDTYAKDPLSFERGTGFLPGMDTKQLVCWFFYFQFRHFKYSEVWMTALEQDEEIRAYIIKELRAYQKRLENLNVLLEKNIAFLEK